MGTPDGSQDLPATGIVKRQSGSNGRSQVARVVSPGRRPIGYLTGLDVRGGIVVDVGSIVRS